MQSQPWISNDQIHAGDNLYPVIELRQLCIVLLRKVDVSQTVAGNWIDRIQLVCPNEQLASLGDVVIDAAIILAQIRQRLLQMAMHKHVSSHVRQANIRLRENKVKSQDCTALSLKCLRAMAKEA